MQTRPAIYAGHTHTPTHTRIVFQMIGCDVIPANLFSEKDSSDYSQSPGRDTPLAAPYGWVLKPRRGFNDGADVRDVVGGGVVGLKKHSSSLWPAQGQPCDGGRVRESDTRLQQKAGDRSPARIFPPPSSLFICLSEGPRPARRLITPPLEYVRSTP